MREGSRRTPSCGLSTRSTWGGGMGPAVEAGEAEKLKWPLGPGTEPWGGNQWGRGAGFLA